MARDFLIVAHNDRSERVVVVSRA